MKGVVMRKEKEEEMRKAFGAQARRVLDERIPSGPSDSGNVIVGIESELAVWRAKTDEQDLHQLRNLLLERTGADRELGACQMELRTPPITILAGGNELLAAHQAVWGNIERSADEQGLQVLRLGANPFLSTRKVRCSTECRKYQAVPDFHRAHLAKGGRTMFPVADGNIPVDPTTVGLFQAYHINVQTPNPTVGVEWLNRALMIAPYLMAPAGSSSYLRSSRVIWDTSMNDCRLAIWEATHTTRRWGWRGGLPQTYFVDPADYLRRISAHPFILYDPQHALQIANGLAWLDARLKFIGGKSVLEFRPIPTQPTVEEENAFAGFFLGRLAFANREQEDLPIEVVRQNRDTAMQNGMKGSFICRNLNRAIVMLTGAQMLELELRKAETGLAELGIQWDLDPVRAAAINGSPTDRLRRSLRGEKKVSDYAMMAALQELGMMA